MAKTEEGHTADENTQYTGYTSWSKIKNEELPEGSPEREFLEQEAEILKLQERSKRRDTDEPVEGEDDLPQGGIKSP